MSELYSEIKYGDILTTTVKPNSKLYHLSINPNLDKLNPNNILNPIYPESGYKQLLPKRVCFTPTIENCIPGVYSLFDDNNTRLTKYTPNFLGLSNYNDNDYNAVILYLYEGIPDKDTKYIKPEVIKIAVPEALYSNEISVTTPIPVTKLSKYIFIYNRIKYRKNKNNLDLSIFEYIDEYSGSHEPKMLVGVSMIDKMLNAINTAIDSRYNCGYTDKVVVLDPILGCVRLSKDYHEFYIIRYDYLNNEYTLGHSYDNSIQVFIDFINISSSEYKNDKYVWLVAKKNK